MNLTPRTLATRLGLRAEPPLTPAYTLGAIEIGRPWTRTTPASAPAEGFLALLNKGTTPDRLIAARSPAAARVEISGNKVVGARLHVLELENGIAVPVNYPMTLQPGRYHLKLIGLAAALVEGARVPVTLTFEKAGSIDIELVVEAG